MGFQSVNPATDEVVATYEEMSAATWQGILNASHEAFLKWRRTTFTERSEKLVNLAKTLRRKKDELAHLMTLEMGKPIAQALTEIEKCAWNCEFYAEHGAEFLQDEIIATDTKKSLVTYQPLGVILGIMPWNFPFWQVFRFLAPTLMAGNAVLLKHASNVCGSALAIEDVCLAAGLPQNLFRVLLVSSKQIPDVIANANVRAVTLTGSTAAGKSVATEAGKHLKKTVLELGGSDPYVILSDADLESAAEICVKSRTLNTGQSCIAAKRFIAVKSVYDEFQKLFIAKMRALKQGDPLDPATELGPLARPDLREELHYQVGLSVAKGAKLELGGEMPSGIGAFYPATVLTEVKPGMAAFDQELFGPVAALVCAEDEAHAFELANQSAFGLGGAIFTRDVARGETLAKTELDAGNVSVNALVKSDPRLPFGGIKASGYGRELGVLGSREFVNVKTVVVE